MSVLGLDLGTRTGWATYDGTTMLTGAWQLGGDPWRYLAFARHLLPALDGHSVVGYERVYAHRGTAAAHVYGGLRGVLLECACDREVPLHAVTVQAVKMRATGSGRASKAEVIAAAEREGWGRLSSDEADAAWVAVLTWEAM